MTKIRFCRRSNSGPWRIAGIDSIILCTPYERRKIQSLQVGQKLLLQDWPKAYRISRDISGDTIVEDRC